MRRAGIGGIVALAVVAVSCGQGAADEPAPIGSSTAAQPSTLAPAQTSVASTSAAATPSTTAASATSAASTTSATTVPAVACTGFGELANAAAPALTYVADGRLWSADFDEPRCITELPESVAGLAYEWGPSGDKLLFADGTVIGVETSRSAVSGIAASLGWTRPTGTSTVHIANDGSLHKVGVADGVDTPLAPLSHHDAVAYHPDGTTFAISGSDGFEAGVWIARNDGTDAQAFAFADLDVVITEMTFTTDARWLVFVADHSNDAFDSGFHLHTAFTEPIDLDGVMTLGAEFEGSNTLLFAESPIDTIRVPSSGSGVGALPDGLLAAVGECGADRRAVFASEDTAGDAEGPIVLIDQPSQPVGYIDRGSAVHRVVVATSADGCNGPFDLYDVAVNTITGDVASARIAAGVTNAAIRASLPAVDITLAGVVIEPFA